MKKKRFPHPEKSPHWWRYHPGQRCSFGTLEESAATGLWKAKRRETYTDGWYHDLALPSLRRSSTGLGKGWVLRFGLRRSDPGRGLELATWRQPEGTGVWCTITEGIWEEAWARQKGKGPLLGGARREGWDRHRSFFLRACTLRQQGTTYTRSGGRTRAATAISDSRGGRRPLQLPTVP